MRAAALLTTLAVLAVAGRDLSAQADERDVVHLKNGKELRGRVVLQTDDAVVLRSGTVEKRIPRDQVERVESIAASLRELLPALLDVGHDDVAGLTKLAKQCAERGLDSEARLLWWRVLLADDQNAAANEALGHHEAKGRWGIPVAGRLHDLAEVEKYRSDWDDAWQLQSEHFAVRCNLGLEATLDVLFELEAFYDAFQRLFQQPLGLKDFVEPIQVYVYGDRDEFPSISNNVGAFFSPAENILYTYMERGGVPYALFHEATHAVLHNAIEGASRGRGALPDWLDEGWAEFMQTVVARVAPGVAKLDETRRAAAHEQTLQREAKDLYGLHRVLNFKAGDFQASSKQQLKYAQSYALFRYCLQGAEGRYRDRFLDYHGKRWRDKARPARSGASSGATSTSSSEGTARSGDRRRGSAGGQRTPVSSSPAPGMVEPLVARCAASS